MSTVNVTTPSANPKGRTIHFDPSYIKTIPAILKIVAAVVSLIGFICVYTIYDAAYRSAGGWYSFVSMTGFWVQLIVTVLYVFHIVEATKFLPWLISETIFAGVWSAFFFIAASVAAAHGRLDPGWGAAAFFGYAVMFVYGYEAFIKYKAMKSGEPAQGEKSSPNVDSSTSTGPSYPTY